MDLISSMQISSSGLHAHKKRMAAISSNIANTQTTRTAEGGPYRPKRVVFSSAPIRESFAQVFDDVLKNQAEGVYASEVVSSNKPPILKYDPHHPDADERGYVAYPDINSMEEMADMIATSRNYEANITALNTAKSMAMKALEIGK